MTLAEKLLKEFESLTEDKKQEVIDFVELLKNKNQSDLENMMHSIIVENKEALLELGK